MTILSNTTLMGHSIIVPRFQVPEESTFTKTESFINKLQFLSRASYTLHFRDQGVVQRIFEILTYSVMNFVETNPI